MADKKKQLGDFIEVTLPAFGPDVNARVYRDSVPNERQWQELKATARSAGTLRTVMESEPPGGPRAPSGKMPQEDGDFLDLKDPMTGVTVRMPRGDIPERRWKKLREQAAKGETTADFGQQTDALEAQGAREVQPVTFPLSATERQLKLAEGQGTRAGAPQVATEPLDASVPAGASLNEVVKPKVTELPAGEPAPSDSGGGTLGSMARKMMGSLAGGALPGGVADAGVPSPDGGVPGALSSPPAEPSGPLPATQPPAGPPGAPFELTGIAPGAGRTPADLLKSAGNTLLGPSPGAQLTDLVNAGKQSVQNMPLGPPAQAPVDPNATGAKLGVKTATTTPGAVGGGLESDLNRAYADRMRAQKDLAQQEAAKSAEMAQAEVAKAKSLQIAEQARAAKAQSMLDAQNQLVQAQMKVAESLGEALKVDPKRLWNNRTAEQKANAQLAGFLFGLSGSGADYVRGLQQEVQKDIDTQIQQFEANRSAKVAQFNAYGNVFAQYRQMGLDAATSAEAAKASILDVHQSKLKELEFKYQGTSAGARAADAAAALGVERVAGLNKLRDSAAQRASLMEARRLQQLDIEAKLEARKAKAAGGPALPATLKKEMADIQDSLANIDAMMADASGGFFARGAIDAASSIPGGGLVAPEQRAKGRDYAGRAFTMMTNLARGALQPAEMEALSRIIPKEIKASEDPEPYLRKAREFLVQSLARRERDYANVGPDVRGPSSASNYGGGE